MSTAHDPAHEQIVVDGSDDGSEPLLDDADLADPDAQGTDASQTGDVSDNAQLMDAPDASQEAPEADQAPPPAPDEGDTCNHPRRPNDVHHTKCEPCRQRDGILLCDYDACCDSCYKLPPDVFAQMLNDRKENARKLQLKRDRLAKKAQQSEPTRLSPRLAAPSASTSSASAPPARRLSSEEVRNLLQTSPQVSPAKPAAALPPNPSYSDLKLHKMSLKRFCARQGFHTETAARAESIAEFFTVPLATISNTLMDLDKPSPQVTPTQRYHATPTSPPAQVRRRIPMLPATPHSPRARSNTPADFVVSDSPADLATEVSQDKPFRELLQLVAERANVQAEAPAAEQLLKPTSAGFVKRTDQGPRLGLTTAPLVATVLENRDSEVKSLRDQGKLRDFGRITSLKSLHVKMQQYMAGDDVFPMYAPPSPLTHDQWLPALHKHHQITFSAADVEALETTARGSLRLASVLDSTISALVSELPDPLSEVQQRILTWLGTIVQDNAQLAAFSATSLMQRRRDAVLKSSEFSTAEKNELRASPMCRQATLFDQKLALETMDRARQRTTDANMHRMA